MKKLWENIKHYYKCTALCIKYPFLYPRNRFDGKYHHNIYCIYRFLNKLYKRSFIDISVAAQYFKNVKDIPEMYTNTNTAQIDTDDFSITFNKDTNIITIYNKYNKVEVDLKRVQYPNFHTEGIRYTKNTFGYPTIQYAVVRNEGDNGVNYGFSFKNKKLIVNPTYYKLYRIFDWINENIFYRIFIIPSHTELDAMDTAWRNKFGLQMCKEIKAALLKDGGYKLLYSYRITQIKEKMGYLRWYDAYTTENVQKVIKKYGKISYHTCFNCGKPAQWVSTGYILPYCNDCIEKDENGNPSPYYKLIDDTEENNI